MARAFLTWAAVISLFVGSVLDENGHVVVVAVEVEVVVGEKRLVRKGEEGRECRLVSNSLLLGGGPQAVGSMRNFSRSLFFKLSRLFLELTKGTMSSTEDTAVSMSSMGI